MPVTSLQRRRTMPPCVTWMIELGCWVCGSQADFSNEHPNDWDIFVPLPLWKTVASALPSFSLAELKLTRFGGLRARASGTTIDVWTGELSDLILLPEAKHFWHPKTNTHLSKNPL